MGCIPVRMVGGQVLARPALQPERRRERTLGVLGGLAECLHADEQHSCQPAQSAANGQGEQPPIEVVRQVGAERDHRADQPNGRGMHLIQAIAVRWGIYRHHNETGKRVWADLRFTADTRP